MRWWHPQRLAARRANLAKRAAMVNALRGWFGAEQFVEVETPILQPAPAPEPTLDSFMTRLKAPGDCEGAPIWLHTSPEIAMKKLLVAGESKIWQLARVFRNGERADTHHPEFTMLEWYRAHAGYQALMHDCEDILRFCARAAGVARFSWQGREADPEAPFERLTVQDAFRRVGIDLLGATSLESIGRAARAIGVAPRDGDRWDDVFFRVFLERIEPTLGVGRPTLLYDYPASMAALARLKPEDDRVAERVELYVCGLELANGFGELTDAIEQRLRLTAAGVKPDEDFLAALAHGMPPAAGMALGFDRLVMLATGAPRIEDVLWAPVT